MLAFNQQPLLKTLVQTPAGMKAYLKSADGIFQLAPKVTTIGREGCDLVVQVCYLCLLWLCLKILLSQGTAL